jgi:hypothetical protein
MDNTLERSNGKPVFDPREQDEGESPSSLLGMKVEHIRDSVEASISVSTSDGPHAASRETECKALLTLPEQPIFLSP